MAMMYRFERLTEADNRQLLSAHIACERVSGCSDKPDYKDT